MSLSPLHLNFNTVAIMLISFQNRLLPFCFETRSHVAQADLDLPLSVPSCGILGVSLLVRQALYQLSYISSPALFLKAVFQKQNKTKQKQQKTQLGGFYQFLSDV